MSKIEPILVTVTDACKMLGFGRTKIYELIRAGELTPIKIGSSTRLEVAELRQWVERQKSAA